MDILVLFILLLGPSLSFAKDSKDNSRPSKIQYSGEGGYQPDDNGIYGSSNSFNPYGGLPFGYGGQGGQEIPRNRFGGSDSSSQDQNQGNGYQNDQSTGGSGSLYPGIGGGNEVPNGVFSNPFLGQRRTFSTPSYGDNDSGDEQGYGGGAYPSGRFTPSYGGQPGIYSSSGFRPGGGQGFIYPTDGGYVYPLAGAGRRQSNYPYGYGIGNGYGGYPGTLGVYPGVLRNVPVRFVPSTGGNGIYGENPRGYGPSLFGSGQYPEMAYPGLGFEYGRLNESSPRGQRPDGNVPPQGAGFPYPYPQSTPPSVPPNGTSEEKAKSLRKEDP